MKKAFALLAVAAAFLALGFTAQPSYAVGSIGGVVTDADGNGVVGAMVMVQGVEHRRGQRMFMARAETGEGGAYEVADVPAGRYIVAAMTRELGGARAEAVVEDGQRAEVNLQLQGRGGGGGGEERVVSPLNGHVIDADGAAVEGARVVLMPARMARGRMRMPRLNAVTDANGNFRIDEVPVGVWIVTAMKRGVGAGRARVEVLADQEANVEVVLNHRR